MKSLLEKINYVYEFLEDDLSKKIFDKKIEWMLLGKQDATIDIMYEIHDKSRILDFEKNYEKNQAFAIAGAGRFSELTYRALKHAGYSVVYFLDHDKRKQGGYKFGVPIISFVEFCSRNEDVVVILDNIKFANEFFRELQELGYPQSKIYRSRNDIVRTSFGNIYFDLPQLKRDDQEVFLDCGCFDGETTLEFVKWCKGKYEKIYAFEPLEEGLLLMKKALNGLERLEVIECGLSECDGETMFTKSYSGLMGAHVGNVGDEVIKIQQKSIDSVLNGRKATFIKMDIEGSEFAALKGAVQTIKKYKPKLAISMYHKNEDIFQIPIFLKEIMPEYRFYLRHYSNKKWDFVLYCV